MMKEARRTFDSRVVLVDEMALDQLDRQARFTDATAADDDELVLSQELLFARKCQSLVSGLCGWWRRTPESGGRTTISVRRRMEVVGSLPLWTKPL